LFGSEQFSSPALSPNRHSPKFHRHTILCPHLWLTNYALLVPIPHDLILFGCPLSRHLCSFLLSSFSRLSAASFSLSPLCASLAMLQSSFFSPEFKDRSILSIDGDPVWESSSRIAQPTEDTREITVKSSELNDIK
jgi:hypothetical protein